MKLPNPPTVYTGLGPVKDRKANLGISKKR
jgi:hypothetical protein